MFIATGTGVVLAFVIGINCLICYGLVYYVQRDPLPAPKQLFNCWCDVVFMSRDELWFNVYLERKLSVLKGWYFETKSIYLFSVSWHI